MASSSSSSSQSSSQTLTASASSSSLGDVARRREAALALADDREEVRLLADFDECKASVRWLVEQAKEKIEYSTFICDPFVRLPQWSGGPNGEPMTGKVEYSDNDPTVRDVLVAAAERGVEVRMAYNPASCYGNLSVAEFKAAMAPVEIVCLRGSLGPAPWMLYFSNNESWSYHHQKYVAIDSAEWVMVTGCDMNTERAGWLEVNELGYYWHELGAVIHARNGSQTKAAMASWFSSNTSGKVSTQRVPPLPLVAHATEAQLMRELIEGAKSSIHLENQAFMSGESSQNGIVGAIAARVVRAVEEGDDAFRVVILTNMAQQDEPSFVTRLYCSSSLVWSLRHLERTVAAAGVSTEQLYQHVFVGFLEHDSVLVKVHSNMIVVDSQHLIRSSSNLSDRSLSSEPTDSELGLFVSGPEVAAFQARLFSRYLSGEDVAAGDVVSVFAAAQAGHGIFVPVERDLYRWPDFVLNALIGFLQSTPATGGKERTEFSIRE
ncbi:phospholipase D [Thecamonas trahens ATCC 50062]|uniref:Phospholipase D n=1 Tax=Thecamonas trahens ATCC 50062 TaxID=461836 RepID=A0A0L0DUJ0_THETB|nr:phospholipase D [Thecamonas trahens ATCC 50062]KNC55721.1 phospholipase D [Thecamonas trahens ATCC 50062]|eukprot:XP_013752929.1 phospholipase D [Thecamonas trahens ATCC 50062]